MRTVILFQSNQILSSQQVREVEKEMEQFLKNWTSHTNPISCVFEMRHHIFLIFKVDETKVALSGCSKDTLFKAVIAVGKKLGLEFLDRQTFAFLVDRQIILSRLNEIEKLVKKYDKSKIRFFNTLINKESDLDNSFIVPFESSWLEQQALQLT